MSIAPRYWLALFLGASSFTVPAQSLSLGGPSTGLVYDQPSRSLRQVLGSPGAAWLSPAVLTDVAWASVAPNGKTVLAGTQNGVVLFASGVNSSNQTGTPVSGVVDSPEYFSWTTDSRAVVIYSSVARSAQWVRVVDQGVIADTPIPLTGVDGDVTDLIVDDVSSWIFFTVAQSGVYAVSATDSVRMILPVPDSSAIALEPGGRSLWVANRTNAQLIRMTPPGTGTPQVLLSDPEKLSDITAMTVSSDGKRLYLANRASLRLYVLDPTAATLSDWFSLDSPVTRFAALGRPSLRLLAGLRDKPEQPFYVLDEASDSGLFFIPAGGEQ